MRPPLFRSVLLLVCSAVLSTCGGGTVAPAPIARYPILFIVSPTAEWQPFTIGKKVRYTAHWYFQNVSGLPDGRYQVLEAAPIGANGDVYPAQLPPLLTDFEPRTITTSGNDFITLIDDNVEDRPPATNFRLRVKLTVSDGREESVTRLIPLRAGPTIAGGS